MRGIDREECRRHFPRVLAKAARIRIGLIGTGMFGGDVHLRAYADLQRFGISGQLARLGFDAWTRELAPVKFELVALGTRTEPSAKRAVEAYSRNTQPTPRTYYGETPWLDILRDFPDLEGEDVRQALQYAAQLVRPARPAA